MPPAIIAAGVTAAATVGGAVLSNKASNKATQQAADTSLQVASQNNALQRDIYGQNQAALAPYMTRGNQAGDAMMELLGFMPQQPANNNAALGQFATNQQFGQPIALGGYQDSLNDLGIGSSLGGYTAINQRGVRNLSTLAQTLSGQQALAPPQLTQPVPQGVVQPQQSAISAFDRYRDSAGYNFRFDEGMRALNAGYAGSGLLDSGAARKASIRYGQDFGSNEFGRYMGYLGNQQGVGLSGASALAGVGQNYANSVSANNLYAGDVAANAALARGNANSQMYGQFAGALGNIFGTLGSSYGK